MAHYLSLTYAAKSIALCAGFMPATCSKRFKKRVKISYKCCVHRKYKLNRPLAGIEPAQSAIEYIVTAATAQSTSEVQHA